jgi:hypothetical protein
VDIRAVTDAQGAIQACVHRQLRPACLGNSR